MQNKTKLLEALTVASWGFFILFAFQSIALAKNPDAGILKYYSSITMRFESNESQTDAQVKSISRSNGYTMFLTPYDTDNDKKKYEYYYSRQVLLIEIEPKNIFGAKYFVHKKRGFFIGGKFTFNVPDGKKYNWTQDRAKTFYKSDFLGYSKKQYYGFNIGCVYMILNERIFLYSGIGFLSSVKYRQYYDNTFTKWSNNYYIEDGSISNTDFDFLLGTYLKFKQWIISLGYSTGSSGIVFGLGYSSN